MGLKLTLVIIIVLGFIFMETAVILFFGMLPTIAAFISDRSVGRNKTISVGAMNFAGCFPFLLEFWTEFGQQTVDNALRLIADAQTVIVIYMLAAGGYAIDKAVTGIAVGIISQRTESRLKKIDKEQEKLVKRWGEKVTGQYQLDDYGFPVRPIPEKKKPSETDGKNHSEAQENNK